MNNNTQVLNFYAIKKMENKKIINRPGETKAKKVSRGKQIYANER